MPGGILSSRPDGCRLTRALRALATAIRLVIGRAPSLRRRETTSPATSITATAKGGKPRSTATSSALCTSRSASLKVSPGSRGALVMGAEASAPALPLEQRFAPAEPGGDRHHLGELPPGRRVGGEEAGRAGQDQRSLLGPPGPGVVLPDGGLVGLVPVEFGVLGEQRPAEQGDDPAGVSTAGEVPIDEDAGVVDPAFLVPAALQDAEVDGGTVGGRRAWE